MFESIHENQHLFGFVFSLIEHDLSIGWKDYKFKERKAMHKKKQRS